jgi:hypothetical protein
MLKSLVSCNYNGNGNGNYKGSLAELRRSPRMTRKRHDKRG